MTTCDMTASLFRQRDLHFVFFDIFLFLYPIQNYSRKLHPLCEYSTFALVAFVFVADYTA